MSGREGRARRPLVTVLLALVVFFEGARASAQASSEDARSVVVRGADGVTVWTLQGAVRVASRWLDNPGCQQLFSDFRDRHGRLLAENLRATAKTPSTYLRWLVFWDGTHERACIWSDSFATTSPGSRVVRLCPVFKKLQGDLGHAAAIVIHEELHSLGLGENPPSSLEITERVLARCGNGGAAARMDR